jgi:hypothetical protein
MGSQLQIDTAQSHANDLKLVDATWMVTSTRSVYGVYQDVVPGPHRMVCQ